VRDTNKESPFSEMPIGTLGVDQATEGIMPTIPDAVGLVFAVILALDLETLATIANLSSNRPANPTLLVSHVSACHAYRRVDIEKGVARMP
jgi:hypothetical protein